MKINKLQFIIQMVIKIPLFTLIRMYVLTLICLAVFYFGVRINKFHLAAFLVSLIVIISAIVVIDVKANSLSISITHGKLTKLDS